MSVQSGDFGFCPHVGHSGAAVITWEGNTVVGFECAFGNNYRTCGFADVCPLYQRHPIGYVQQYPGASGQDNAES